MEMMNRAIEGASDFRDMMQKLQRTNHLLDEKRDEVAAVQTVSKPPKRRGENREQYRARLNAKA